MSLKEKYTKEIVPKLKEEFGYKNNLAVPKVTQVNLNVGLGANMKDSKFIDTVENTLTRITGQRPVKTLARKSIATFHIREGNIVGMKASLHGNRMWDFLEKLTNVSIARIRDFRGLSPKSFDGEGNFSIGFKEHIIFPEIRSDEIEVLHGLQVTVSTTAKSNKEGIALLKALGFPIKDK
ncbi:MAG: 50S ribosomal protein L5 [Patescibacteria group bacterium]